VIAAESNGYKLYKGRTTDNKHLPKDYVANLAAQYPAQLLEAYLNGEFVNLNDGIIQRHWFKPSTVINHTNISMGVDLAISQKTSADATAIVIGAVDENGVFHVIYAIAKRVTFNDAQELIKQLAQQYQPKIINIEAVQYQLAAVQELMRTTRLPVIAVRPDKDKASRLMPLAARYEQGMVCHAPANSTNHIKQLEDELTAFPNGAHDDLVDALVYCWNGIESSMNSGFYSGGRRLF
jgi:predicted phage terminase large subunit-like protein